ncbi:sigma-70 family RNA polymerase sigma factor [Pseudomonas sp. JUb96]|uniref:sigma-70 family RNA polymerase sigma factor n=1 Tax=Pseudomonas sp. JUb96 TaxID=2940539 RepID=UPI0039B3663E|nr:RNA polymerase sigma-70 factor (ECF subfamily) [Pseudomonas sp. JUb96]
MLPSPAFAPETRDRIAGLYRDHHLWLLTWLQRRHHFGDQASDVAQDTFLHAILRPQQIAGLRQPRAWLSSVARGLLIDRYRRQKLEAAYLRALAQLPEAEAPSAERQLMLLETLMQIDASLDGLAPKVRMAFLLSRLDGLSYQEIAARQGVSLSSVEKYMSKAIRHCYQLSLEP